MYITQYLRISERIYRIGNIDKIASSVNWNGRTSLHLLLQNHLKDLQSVYCTVSGLHLAAL